MTAWSTKYVCGRTASEIADSNFIGSMDVLSLAIFCVLQIEDVSVT